MTVKYVNSNGKAFVLLGDGLTFVDPNELHTWEWGYTLSNRISGMGGDASGFSRFPRTFDLELRMRGMNREEFVSQANRLHDITEADMVAGQPGRLYVDDQYLVCYLAVSGDKPSHPRNSNFLTREVTVLAVEPYWCTPVTVTLSPEQAHEQGDDYVKVDPARYGGFTLYGGSGDSALRWSFNNNEGVTPSSGTYYYAVYEIPEGMEKVEFTGYHYNSNFAGCGFYNGVPGVGEKLWTYTAPNNTKVDTPTEVEVPATATHMVIQLGSSLARGLFIQTGNGKKYDLRYGYRYGTGLSGNTINNTHYAPAPMVITFFGPAAAPTITIDGVQYGADVQLTATDRLVIDQLKHQVYIESDTGVKTSAFNSRIKTSDVFAPIQTGAHTVVYSGDFSATVTMIYQRSELRWTA